MLSLLRQDTMEQLEVRPVLTFLNVDQLVAIENVEIQKVLALEEKIRSEQIWNKPVLVHDEFFFIMDGHHRLAVSKRMGLKRIPALLLNYDSPHLQVVDWNSGKNYDVNRIFDAFREKRLLGIKDNRHILSYPIPELKIPLDLLSK